MREERKEKYTSPEMNIENTNILFLHCRSVISSPLLSYLLMFLSLFPKILVYLHIVSFVSCLCICATHILDIEKRKESGVDTKTDHRVINNYCP